MSIAIYALPAKVAGTAAVGGCTHVDATDVGREGRTYWCRVTGGTRPLVDDPEWVDPGNGTVAPKVAGPFVPLLRPVPFVQTIRITDADAFEQWCAAPVAQGGRGRGIDSEGHAEYIERDILLYALNQWLAE